jgi:hypothetical protein
VIYTTLAKKLEGTIVLNLFIKGQFRSGQEADRHSRWAVMNYELGTELANRGKPTGT